MRHKTLDKIHKWSLSIGLPLNRVSCLPDELSVWPDVVIFDGCVLYTCEVTPDDLLHELGHVALTPAGLRPFLRGDLLFDCLPFWEKAKLVGLKIEPTWKHLSDSAVIGWSYFVALNLGLDSHLVSSNWNKNSDAEVFVEIEKGIGTDVGSHPSSALFNAGLLKKKGGDRLTRFLF